jgi:hypothetical protein
LFLQKQKIALRHIPFGYSLHAREKAPTTLLHSKWFWHTLRGCFGVLRRTIAHGHMPEQHAISTQRPVLTQGDAEAQRPAARTARSAYSRLAARSAIRSLPGRDTRSGQGALARRHTDGPLCAALLKTTVMCEAWRRRTSAPPGFFLDFLLASSASPKASRTQFSL